MMIGLIIHREGRMSGSGFILAIDYNILEYLVLYSVAKYDAVI